jgi:hypothetical protein
MLDIEQKSCVLMTAADARRHLATGKPFYVYILHRPTDEPFYVGKGVALRVFHHEAEARNTRSLTHKLNLIRSLQIQNLPIRYSIAGFFEEESEALALERHLIATIGRHDLKSGPLTNQTDGGEGTSNPSEESRQRRRDSLWGEEATDPERKIANRYFQQLTPVRSVPIKPVSTFKRADGLWKNDDTIGMSRRQAGALLASAIENRVLLEPGALLPRRLAVEGIEYIIENGVGRDMISNGMITLADATRTHEILRLSDIGYQFILENFDPSSLVDAGILLPEKEKTAEAIKIRMLAL